MAESNHLNAFMLLTLGQNWLIQKYSYSKNVTLAYLKIIN